jgi:hypothetical protein
MADPAECKAVSDKLTALLAANPPPVIPAASAKM